MLTKREFDQIGVALIMSDQHNINGQRYIHLNNTLVLLQEYVEPDAPRGLSEDSMDALRKAGGAAWDKVPDPAGMLDRATEESEAGDG